MSTDERILREKFFPMPNRIYSLGLCAEEIAIYGYLMYLENRKTYTCHPSYKTIGRAVGMTENTVRKYIRSLEAKGFIYTEPTTVRPRNGRTRNGNLRYTVRPIADAIERYEEKLLASADQARAQQEYKQRIEAYDQAHPSKEISTLNETASVVSPP